MTRNESSYNRVKLRYELLTELEQMRWGDVYVLSHEQTQELLTPVGRDVINKLMECSDFESVEELSQEVEHIPNKVRTILKKLTDAGIIRHSGDELGEYPYIKPDTIVVEPITGHEEHLVG